MPRAIIDHVPSDPNWSPLSPAATRRAGTKNLQFKGKSGDVRRIGEWLGVCALVSGSVRKEGARLRVLVQLIDTETGLNLWSGGYEREWEGVLATQEKISRELAGILQRQFGVPGG